MPQPLCRIAWIAACNCGPQSHFRLPSTSPVRHSLCNRTRGPRRWAGRSAARHGRPRFRASERRRSRHPPRPRPAAARASPASIASHPRAPSMSARKIDTSAPLPPTKKAGSSPAMRASFSAAADASRFASARVRNGPFIGVARSNCGSASAVAAAKSIHGARSTSTGVSGSAASSWLTSFSVAARPALIRIGASPVGSNAASRCASPVSTASSVTPSIAIGQPRRTASMPRAAALGLGGGGSLTRRIRS